MGKIKYYLGRNKLKIIAVILLIGIAFMANTIFKANIITEKTVLDTIVSELVPTDKTHSYKIAKLESDYFVSNATKKISQDYLGIIELKCETMIGASYNKVDLYYYIDKEEYSELYFKDYATYKVINEWLISNNLDGKLFK